jgi:hydroxyethylthiazole kinase-like uncharacterized protein yjeF
MPPVPETWTNEPARWSSQLPWPRPDGNKYDRGHALVVGGGRMTGAARLAARGAARAGAGVTTLAVPAAAFPIYATAMTSILVAPLAEPGDLQRLLGAHRVSAALIGPGAGVGEQTRAQVVELLGQGIPLVLDADALTSCAEQPAALFQAIAGPCVLTPHEGEFARLFASAGDKAARARAAARLSGAVVVLKGAGTVIAAPDGRAIADAAAPPTLATAGSGDVLAGIILGLLAQGMDAFAAAAAAVWMHGAAATAFGPGLIAEDLPEQLPAVLRRLAGAHPG